MQFLSLYCSASMPDALSIASRHHLRWVWKMTLYWPEERLWSSGLESGSTDPLSEHEASCNWDMTSAIARAAHTRPGA